MRLAVADRVLERLAGHRREEVDELFAVLADHGPHGRAIGRIDRGDVEALGPVDGMEEAGGADARGRAPANEEVTRPGQVVEQVRERVRRLVGTALPQELELSRERAHGAGTRPGLKLATAWSRMSAARVPGATTSRRDACN